MQQSKKESFVESLVNTIIGYFVGLATQYICYPLFGIQVSVQDQMLLALIFMLTGLVKNYLIRRWFNTHFKATIKMISRLF